MKLKFLGSDSWELNDSFTVGRKYEAEKSEWIGFSGFYDIEDDNHEPWMVDIKEGEFEVIP